MLVSGHANKWGQWGGPAPPRDILVREIGTMMRRRAPALGFVFAVLATAGLWSAQAVPKSDLIDAPALLHDLQALSADDMQGRQVGTPGGEKARAYVIERFKASGIAPLGESLSSHSRSPGAAPAPRADGRERHRPHRRHRSPRRYIVISAHYDHIGVRNGHRLQRRGRQRVRHRRAVRARRSTSAPTSPRTR